MTSTIVYLPPRGVILFPNDIVTFEGNDDEVWLVVGVKPGCVFMELLRLPTDAEIHDWLAA